MRRTKFLNLRTRDFQSYQSILWGALIPFGFAPFHLQGLLYFGILFFYLQLETYRLNGFKIGYLFGIGFHLVGTSWIYVSIHEYGHIHSIFAGLITFLFILIMATFYGLMSMSYQYLKTYCSALFKPMLFASLWCLSEYFRAHFLGGFPWLLLGYSALKTPFEKLLLYVGVYGPSFCCTAGIAYLATGILQKGRHRLLALLGLACFAFPSMLPAPQESTNRTPKLSIGMIQANVKMQDKWDEQLFWQHYTNYLEMIQKLLAPHRLIILPEAAFAIPSLYFHEELSQLARLARTHQSALLFGIPQSRNQFNYYNSIMALGEAKGHYFKQQLVPFGEYIPTIWLQLIRLLNFPVVNTLPGPQNQKPIKVFRQDIASLICYELAYPERLRHQLPKGKFIVSVNDDGWFGHSLALYQHLQMAQTLSYMSYRDQIFSNNNGLSSHINAHGELVEQLPAWKTQASIVNLQPHTLQTFWMHWGDFPVIFLCFNILSFALLLHSFKIVRLANRFNTYANL